MVEIHGVNVNVISIDQTGHGIDTVKAKLPKWCDRGVKEAIHISASETSLNKNGEIQSRLSVLQLAEATSLGGHVISHLVVSI